MQRSWSFNKLLHLLAESNRSTGRVKKVSLTKEQMSSHQPQMSGKTPISTTTSRETCSGSRSLYFIQCLYFQMYLALLDKTIPWQQCSRPPEDVWNAGTGPEQPIPETAIKEQHCFHIYTSKGLAEHISHVCACGFMRLHSMGFVSGQCSGLLVLDARIHDRGWVSWPAVCSPLWLWLSLQSGRLGPEGKHKVGANQLQKSSRDTRLH